MELIDRKVEYFDKRLDTGSFIYKGRAKDDTAEYHILQSAREIRWVDTKIKLIDSETGKLL